MVPVHLSNRVIDMLWIVDLFGIIGSHFMRPSGGLSFE